jgi:hypothetical protein
VGESALTPGRGEWARHVVAGEGNRDPVCTSDVVLLSWVLSDATDRQLVGGSALSACRESALPSIRKELASGRRVAAAAVGPAHPVGHPRQPPVRSVGTV